jgi:hypothetical protein
VALSLAPDAALDGDDLFGDLATLRGPSRLAITSASRAGVSTFANIASSVPSARRPAEVSPRGNKDSRPRHVAKPLFRAGMVKDRLSI